MIAESDRETAQAQRLSRTTMSTARPDGNSSILRTFSHPFSSLVTTLLFVCSILTCATASAALDNPRYLGRPTSKTVNRISYGVIFEYHDDMSMITEYWSHVFIIKLPKKIFGEEQNFLESLNAGNAPAKALCMRHGSQGYYSEKQGLTACRRFEHHVQYLIESATKGYANLHSLVDDIYSLLPRSMLNPSEEDNRRTRALLPFLGTFLSSVRASLSNQTSKNCKPP